MGVELELELTDKSDCLTIRAPAANEILDIIPSCLDNPYLARFFKGWIGRVFTPEEVAEALKPDPPVSGTETGDIPVPVVVDGSTVSTDGATSTSEPSSSETPRVRRITAEDVMGSVKNRSRTAAIADPNKLATPGLIMMVRKVLQDGVEPDPDMTVGEAQSILREAKENENRREV